MNDKPAGPPRRSPGAPQPRRRAEGPGKRSSRPKNVRISCPNCGTRFQAPQRKSTYETSCLACDAAVPVRGTDEIAEAAETAAAPQPAPAEKRRTLFDEMAHIRRVPTAQPVRFPFFTGVFSFPWYPEVIFRWLFLSVGCSMAGVLLLAMNWGMSRGGWMARAAYAFGFPCGWISIWTLSYLAACGTAIIQATAAGEDRITEWPDSDWREWFGEMIGYFPAVGAAVAVAFGAGQLANALDGSFWLAGAWSLFLVTPVFLLSAFEANSMYAIVTPLILASLARRWWAWAQFYVLAAILTVAWPGTFLMAYSENPFYAAAITGPLMAAVLLIDIRLLGRLGLCIADLQPELSD